MARTALLLWPHRVHRDVSVGAGTRDFRDRTGRDADAAGLAAEAQAGNADALERMSRYEHRLARGLASIINVFDPDAIVLGGGVSNIDRLYERVPRIWAEFVFSDTVVTRLARAVHGDSSGVRGAAWLFD